MEPMRKKAVKVTSVQAKAVWILPILLGTAFCFYYLSLAADNVAFSDYVRLINSWGIRLNFLCRISSPGYR